ncbi:MAG: hypothetical protein DBX36_02510 [Oscillospiraceae bacterium]|nr:MAG: hypothetical protein DBX36_02510 [Oscillospiraceae bacterium]
MKQKRLSELSYMNLFYCVLVVFIHVSSEPVTTLERSSLQYFAVMIPWRLSAFVVQGFIFLSGVKLFLNMREPFDTVAFWCKRVKSIILPYILWVLIYYCYYVSIGYFPFRFSDFFRYVLVGDLVSPFYFVIIITQFYLLAPLFIKLLEKVKTIPLLVASFVLMLILWRGLVPLLRVSGICENFIYIDRVFTSYLFYFVFGCVVGKHYTSFMSRIKRLGVPVTLGFIVLAIIDVLSYVFISRIGYAAAEIYHTVYCIGAILFTLYFFDFISRNTKNMPHFIASADRATYLVYLCHCLAIARINYRMELFGISDIGIRYIIRIVCVYILSFGSCMIWNLIKAAFNKRIYGKNDLRI